MRPGGNTVLCNTDDPDNPKVAAPTDPAQPRPEDALPHDNDGRIDVSDPVAIGTMRAAGSAGPMPACSAHEDTCAVTGLRIVNGGDRDRKKMLPSRNPIA